MCPLPMPLAGNFETRQAGTPHGGGTSIWGCVEVNAEDPHTRDKFVMD
jgi:hypothetical protein